MKHEMIRRFNVRPVNLLGIRLKKFQKEFSAVHVINREGWLIQQRASTHKQSPRVVQLLWNNARKGIQGIIQSPALPFIQTIPRDTFEEKFAISAGGRTEWIRLDINAKSESAISGWSPCLKKFQNALATPNHKTWNRIINMLPDKSGRKN